MAKKTLKLSPGELLEQEVVPKSEWPYVIPENWIWSYWKNCGKLVAGN